MLVQNDDDIHRFEGRWIDLRGTEMPVHVRYRVWAIFGMYGTGIVVMMLAAQFGTTNSLLFGLALAFVATLFTSEYVTPETPLAARAATLRAELRAARIARRRRAAEPRPAAIRTATWRRQALR